MEEELAASKEAVEKLPVLKSELDLLSQSHTELEKNVKALERSHSSNMEIKSNLENNLIEKSNQILSLENGVKDLTEKMSRDSKSHALDTENLLHKEKRLKEQLEAAKQSLSAAKAELNSRREEIKTMKTTLSAASRGLEERDNTIKSLKDKLNEAEVEQARTSDLLKEKTVAMNKIKVGD